MIAPLDISGFTRPRVLLDVTEALRQLKVMVFKVRRCHSKPLDNRVESAWSQRVSA